jgi:hypothetical protein
MRPILSTLTLLLAACAQSAPPSAPRPDAAAPATAAAPAPAAARKRPGAARVVAVGDLHGDLAAAKAALRAAGVLGADDRWTGGATVLVQTGDQLDRGDDERALLDLLDGLRPQAEAAGGAVLVLNGNHELMNVSGDFRYVTPAGAAAWGGVEGRRAAFAPGGPEARRLAGRPVYAIVGDTLFAHAGVRPEHVAAGLEALDAEANAWMRGASPVVPRVVTDSESLLWTRLYGTEESPPACAAAKQVLDALGLARMVVAHTVQPGGANAICDGRVWRIDVGLSAHYGGPVQALLLEGGRARVLSGTR